MILQISIFCNINLIEIGQSSSAVMSRISVLLTQSFGEVDIYIYIYIVTLSTTIVARIYMCFSESPTVWHSVRTS